MVFIKSSVIFSAHLSKSALPPRALKIYGIDSAPSTASRQHTYDVSGAGVRCLLGATIYNKSALRDKYF